MYLDFSRNVFEYRIGFRDVDRLLDVFGNNMEVSGNNLFSLIKGAIFYDSIGMGNLRSVLIPRQSFTLTSRRQFY